MLKIKPFRQTPGFCGPASLKMVIGYWGVEASEKAIAKAAGASQRKGANRESLIKAAEHFGFHAFSKEKSSFADLRHFIKRKIPIIVDWFSEDEGHYSVVVDINEKNIILMDPSLKNGRRKMPLEKFRRVWFDFPGKFIKNQKNLILRLMIVITPLKNG